MYSAKISLIACVVTLSCLELTHSANLKCYNGSLQNFKTAALNDPSEIMPCINPALPTVIYTFGYRGKREGPATKTILNAYITKKKKNVILLDWEEEAKSGMLGIPLGYALSAVPHAAKIGKALGDALINISSSGVNMTDIHLMGHSLGAHIMGFAGRRVREQGAVVTRITGLDPARALFEGAFSINRGLDRTCAKFVDIVHSDPGGYGISTATGTVDIWPNYSRTHGTQPGCPNGKFDMFTQEDLCSHDRSWHYFVEALQAPTSFPCAAAEDYDQWIADGEEVKQKIYLGDLTNMRAKGNFYFNTNAESPFGMGAEGMKPDDNQIRKRRNPSFTSFLRYFSKAKLCDSLGYRYLSTSRRRYPTL